MAAHVTSSSVKTRPRTRSGMAVCKMVLDATIPVDVFKP
jgi:hypothetical protein